MSGGDVEIDAELVAPGLGLDVPTFRRLMAAGQVSVLCERGTGDDTGLVRGTFHHGGRRVRIVVDAQGRPVAPVEAGDDARTARGRTGGGAP